MLIIKQKQEVCVQVVVGRGTGQASRARYPVPSAAGCTSPAGGSVAASKMPKCQVLPGADWQQWLQVGNSLRELEVLLLHAQDWFTVSGQGAGGRGD